MKKQSNKAVVHDWVVCGLHVLQIERSGIRVPADPLHVQVYI